MRITKRIREEAALICAIVASGSYVDDNGSRPCMCLYCIARDLDANVDARDLADRARVALPVRYDTRIEQEYCAQFGDAEALLRTGWQP